MPSKVYANESSVTYVMHLQHMPEDVRAHTESKQKLLQHSSDA